MFLQLPSETRIAGPQVLVDARERGVVAHGGGHLAQLVPGPGRVVAEADRLGQGVASVLELLQLSLRAAEERTGPAVIRTCERRRLEGVEGALPVADQAEAEAEGRPGSGLVGIDPEGGLQVLGRSAVIPELAEGEALLLPRNRPVGREAHGFAELRDGLVRAARAGERAAEAETSLAISRGEAHCPARRLDGVRAPAEIQECGRDPQCASPSSGPKRAACPKAMRASSYCPLAP